MRAYVLGALATLAVLGAILVWLGRSHWEAGVACQDANFVVYAFELCAEDEDMRCFVTPEHIEKYSRALTHIRDTSCIKWDHDE